MNDDTDGSRRRQLRERCEREDLIVFVNTCFAATDQNEFYDDGLRQSVPVSFLHEYVRVNYRRVYARCLAIGINHFNRATIIVELLAAGAPARPFDRAEEGELILAGLLDLPANRAYAVLEELTRRRINNRRTRAIIAAFLRRRPEPEFDAIKYRRRYRRAVRHAHLEPDGELADVLFKPQREKPFRHPLFEAFRQAWYSRRAVYDLPFTVAESFAARHGIPRAEFLAKIEPKMTRQERLRLQASAARAGRRPVSLPVELESVPLTRLVIYCLSVAPDERERRAGELDAALRRAARRTLAGSPIPFRRVAVVLDASRSSSGSRQKSKRPLAIAIALHYLMREAADEFHAFWTPSNDARYPFLVEARGPTRLAEPVLDALSLRPELLLIVSDGWENDPPDTVGRVLETARARLAPVRETRVLHANPVFDPEHFSPRPLSGAVPTVGLRNAEDISTMIEFSKFAGGDQTLDALETYLAVRADRLRERA